MAISLSACVGDAPRTARRPGIRPALAWQMFQRIAFFQREAAQQLQEAGVVLAGQSRHLLLAGESGPVAGRAVVEFWEALPGGDPLAGSVSAGRARGC